MAERTVAVVETLTAEVRVMMVGSRQITLSVARQLDWWPWDDCVAFFGRVNMDSLSVALALAPDGSLVRARPGSAASSGAFFQFGRLPLIVLAGLR